MKKVKPLRSNIKNLKYGFVKRLRNLIYENRKLNKNFLNKI